MIQDPNVPSPYTKVTSPTDNKLSFGLASETKYIEVESNEDWEVSEENTSWLASVDTEKTENGGRVAVKSKANDTETAYTAKIIIKGKSSGNTASIDISQEGIIIKGVPESKEFGNGADKYTFSFECNTTWEASSNQTWCTVSPSGRQTGKSLTIYVTENTYTSQRPATVTIKVGNGNVERNISVTQQGTAPYIYIDGEKSITVESTGSEKTIKIATNDSPFTPGSDKEWCTVESVDQTNKTFKIKVKSNGTLSTRTATITVTSKSDKTDTMTVTQKAGNIGVEEYDENDNPIK